MGGGGGGVQSHICVKPNFGSVELWLSKAVTIFHKYECIGTSDGVAVARHLRCQPEKR